MSGGIDVVRIGMGPSPMLYFATHHLDVDGGIQVTGSHNPSDYNGFKMLLKGGSVFGEAIQDLGKRCAEGRWNEGEGSVRDEDISEAYVDRLVEGFSGRRLSGGLGRRQRRRRADPRAADRTPARRASRHLHRGRRHFPQPPPGPDGRSEPRGPEETGRRQGPRLRNRLRRRRRPHRRGRRQRPGHLGRPAAADPLGPGPRRPSPARPSSPTSRPARCCSTASPRSAASR